MRSFTVASVLLFGCASKLSPADQRSLREAAGRDHECPVAEVELLGEVHEKGKPVRYDVDACGRTRKYVRDDDGNFVDASFRAGEHERREDSRERLDHAPPEEE